MKIEQIAFAAKDPEKMMRDLAAVGCKTWVHDEVVADGHVFGEPTINMAELHFNYDLGFELEILCYKSGKNWHQRRNEFGQDRFFSHMGLHVDADEMFRIKQQMSVEKIQIAQEVVTKRHNNPEIMGIKKYHYVVFDSHRILGYDLKLIRRIMLT